MLFRSWTRFSKLVKGYPDRATVPAEDDDELLSPADVPEDIARAITRVSWRMLQQATDLRLVRARAHCPSKQLLTADELGSPPPSAGGSNRMSGAGISMFYAAESETTAIAETRPDPKEAVTTASWTPSRELVYVDLLATQPIPSIFDRTARSDRPWLRFLADFADDLAQPVDPPGDPIEYVPTQIITEYIRDYLRTRSGCRVDAIRYRSAVDAPDGVCWAVFAGQDDCGDHTDGSDRLLILDPDSVKQHNPPAPGHRLP